MNLDTTRDAAAETVFAEREILVKRTHNLDVIEQMFESFTDEQLDTILEMADVFMKAAQLRAQKQGRRGPLGMPGRAPCGK